MATGAFVAGGGGGGAADGPDIKSNCDSKSTGVACEEEDDGTKFVMTGITGAGASSADKRSKGAADGAGGARIVGAPRGGGVKPAKLTGADSCLRGGALPNNAFASSSFASSTLGAESFLEGGIRAAAVVADAPAPAPPPRNVSNSSTGA